MSGAQSISTRRAYGVQRVCRVWRPRPLLCDARRQATRSPALCRRRGPTSAAPDDVHVAHILLEASPLQFMARLTNLGEAAGRGRCAPFERVRRLMRARPTSKPRRGPRADGPKAHDGTITTEAPDVMWGTDMTATVTVAEGAPSSSWPSITARTVASGSIAKRGNRRPWNRSARASANASGASAKAWPVGCGWRHDHGDANFGRSRSSASGSPSFVRAPEGTGVADFAGQAIRTLKVCCGSAASRLEELRLGALLEFKRGTTSLQWMPRLPKPGPGATPSGWTRRRRSEYRQTTVQEP